MTKKEKPKSGKPAPTAAAESSEKEQKAAKGGPEQPKAAQIATERSKEQRKAAPRKEGDPERKRRGLGIGGFINFI